MRQIILASASPRRKELLKQLIGDNFLVYASSYEEPPYPGLSPEELLLKHSVEKARDVAKHFDSGIVISADTVGYLRWRNSGKATISRKGRRDAEKAKRAEVQSYNRAYSS